MGPNGTRLVKTATFPTGDDGTQGRVTATVDSGEIDDTGEWKVQAHVITPGPSVYHSEVQTFQVKGNI